MFTPGVYELFSWPVYGSSASTVATKEVSDVVEADKLLVADSYEPCPSAARDQSYTIKFVHMVHGCMGIKASLCGENPVIFQ